MNKCLLMVMTTFFGMVCLVQQGSWPKLIQGTWELKEVIKDNSHGFTLLDEGGAKQDESTPTLVINFKEKGRFNIIEPSPSKGKYKFRADSVLQLGNRKYKILLIENKTLRMEAADYTLFKPDILVFSKQAP